MRYYFVRNRFESFGHPSSRRFEHHVDADSQAWVLADRIAETFYKREGRHAFIPYYDTVSLGSSEEQEFHSRLNQDSGATPETNGLLLWSDLVDRIYDEVVEIVEE